MKAVRGAEIGLDTLNAQPLTDAPLDERLRRGRTTAGMFTVFEALKAGMTVDEIHEITQHRPLVPVQAAKAWRTMKQSIAPWHDGRRSYTRAAKRSATPTRRLRRLSGAKNLPRHAVRRIRWWTPAPRSLTRETPYFYSAYDAEHARRVRVHALAASRSSSCSARARSASGRASSSTIPPCTASGRCKKLRL